MKLNNYLQEIGNTDKSLSLMESRSFIKKIIDSLVKMSCGKAKQLFKKSTKDMITFFKKNGIEKEALRIINKSFGVNYNSLKQLQKSPALVENKVINEDWCAWWKEATFNMYGALSFYPLLQSFLELDKLVKHSGDADISYVMTYFLIWIAIITGKIAVSGISKKGKIETNIKDMEDRA